jgi:hypothetical protein
MVAPRRLSRPDHMADGRTRRSYAKDLAGYADVRDFFRLQQRESRQIDPGRLIESVFLGETPADDADVVLIAWLAILPTDAHVPAAAAELARHLAQKMPRPHSPLQRRLLELLAYVAAHRRAGDPPTISKPHRKAPT